MATIKTIGKGKKKRYQVRYDGPKDLNGKRQQKQKSFTTSKEAKEFVSRLTLQVEAPQFPYANEMDPSQVLFREYAENWFEVEYYQKVRATTFKTGRYFLEKHVLPYFGDKILSATTKEEIKDFYAQKKREGYAEKTISSIHKFLSTLFQSAVENGDLKEHPMDAMKKSKPKHPIRIANPWSYGEITQFLEAAEKEKKDVMYDFTLSTGLRQGEVFALPWFNIDFDQQTVTVTRSVSYDENGKPELIPKSLESYRTITLSDRLIKKLKAHKEKQEKMKQLFGDHYHHELDLVFPKSDGGFHNPSNVRRQLYGLMEKAKVRRITFHDLRHTHSSMLIRSGANPRIVQERLGHEDIQTTFRYYGHLWVNADKEAIDSLELEMEKHKKQRNQPE